MPRGTTLVGLPQPTQSVQSRILLDTGPCDNGRNPAKLNGHWSGGQVVLGQMVRKIT
jgi:hypothetical protein